MISGGQQQLSYGKLLFAIIFRYLGILEKFRQFCSSPDEPDTLPNIKKGEVPQLVLVGFKQKEDAVRALNSLEEVSVASSSRI